MAKILVTCVGSGVGQSVVDSLILNNDHTVIGIDTNRNNYGHHFCDKFYIAPSLYSDDYIDFLLELCAKENVDVLIPGHDHELLLLSKQIKLFNNKGIEVIVSPLEIIEISRDKYLWYKFFSEKGCPVVPTYRLAEFKKNPIYDIFPAIVKPAAGSASQGISIIDDFNQLQYLNDDDIIQPYLFPLTTDKNYETILKAVKNHKFVQMSEISIQLIFTKDSKFSGIFISQNSLKSGIPVFVDPIQPNNFEYIDDVMKFVPILEKNKARGPVNIQGRITDRGLICFEMNMRFTGITGNRAQLGFNEVEFLINNYLDKGVKLLGYSNNKLGVRQVACTTIPRLEKDLKYKRTFSVYGADGFLGSTFVYHLLNNNLCDKVHLICANKFYNKTVGMFNDSRIEIFSENDSLTETALCKSDVVVNFASALAYNPVKEIFDAIIFQYNQSRKIIKANVPLIINVSSQSVYNQLSDIAKKEDDELDLSSAYAFQKRMAELFFNEAKSIYPLSKVVSLRFSRIIGCHYSGSKPTGFFANSISSLINDSEVNIPYPNNKINLIDVKDVINAIMHVVNTNEKQGVSGIYNVGGENISIKQYCELVLKTLQFNHKRHLFKYSDDEEVTASSMIDCSAFKNRFGWEPKYKLEETIQEMYNKLKEK